MTGVPVLTAAQAAGWDRDTIAGGVPSRALMQRAGAAAAGEIARRFPDLLRRGAAVFAGAGNNGGDAWVVARALRDAGVVVRVSEFEPSRRTDDAAAERALALAGGSFDSPRGGEGVVVDGVLGIGGTGAPRGGAAESIARIIRARAEGATVVALDIPSGLDADTGGTHSVVADLTLTFGAIKRGLLVARDRCGAIAVIDVGFSANHRPSGVPFLADSAWALSRIPAYAADMHKGDRRRIAIIGGATGMAGAVILAGRAALRAGAGLVRVAAAEESIAAVQAGLPEALAEQWRASPSGGARDSWPHGIAIGPGLGATAASRRLVEETLRTTEAPIVLDADALNVFAGDVESLRAFLESRRAVLTPHPAEMSRLAAVDIADVLARRWEIGGEVARRTGAVVLLKGAPTIVSAPDGRCAVIARGTPALATGGSGDVLSGIAATLVAQMDDAFDAVVCAAWAHGRAAELSHEGRSPRGAVLGDVLEALGHVWDGASTPTSIYPVLAELPGIKQ